MSKFTIAMLCLIVVISSSLFAQPSPSVAVDLVEYDQAIYYNHTSHIARTSDGLLVIAWTAPGDIRQIVSSTYDAAFETWSPPVAVSSAPSGEDAHKVGIAADDNGNVYAAWHQEGTWAIYFSKFDGNTWSTPVNLSNNDLRNEEVSIIVNSEGKVFVVWNTDSEADGKEWILCVTSSDGGSSWSTPPDTLSSADGIIGGTSAESGRCFLTAGPSGKVVCLWYEVPDDGTDQEIMINQFDGENWAGEVRVSDNDAMGYRYPAAAIDKSENIYVVYRPFSPRQSLVMKKKGWADAEWPATADTVIKQGYEAYKPYMGIDSDDNLYLVFRADMVDDTTDLEQVNYVASIDGGATWTDQVRLSREGYDAGYVTLAPNVRASGVDVLWREGHFPMVEDPDSLSLVYGHIELLGTAIDEMPPVTANSFRLEQNFPNPFNPETEIRYEIASPGYYEITIFDLLGQKVKTLFSGNRNAGIHRVTWNGTNQTGSAVGTGIYFYQLTGADIDLTRKMVLLR